MATGLRPALKSLIGPVAHAAKTTQHSTEVSVRARTHRHRPSVCAQDLTAYGLCDKLYGGGDPGQARHDMSVQDCLNPRLNPGKRQPPQVGGGRRVRRRRSYRHTPQALCAAPSSRSLLSLLLRCGWRWARQRSNGWCWWCWWWWLWLRGVPHPLPPCCGA